jgi:hypothetical protein
MESRNLRIALAAAVVSLAAPALAADPARDCTVCSDPTWPSLQNLMPGIPLDAAPAAASDRGAVPGDATWLVASNRSPGVGVAVSEGRPSAYADPYWPQPQGSVPAGMAATLPARATPAAKAPAAPKPVPATGPVASR